MRRGRQRRGFAMLVVIIIVALLALIGVSLLRLIHSDLAVVGQAKRGTESRDLVEAASQEIINDPTLTDGTAAVNDLPDLSTLGLQTSYTPSVNSQFNAPPLGVDPDRRFNAFVRLLRIIPIAESSFTWTRGLVYEIEVNGDYKAGASSARGVAEVYRSVSYRPGWYPDRRYYR